MTRNRPAQCLLLFICLCLWSASFQAQADKLEEKADIYLNAFDYGTAIYYYEKSLEKFPDNPEVLRKTGLCYRSLGDLPASGDWLSKAIAQGSQHPLNYLYLAESLKSKGRYEEALQAYRQYGEKAPGDSRAARHTSKSDYYKKLLVPAEEVTIKSLGLNDDKPAFGVTSFENEYIFSSPGENGVSIKEETIWTEMPYLDLFVGSKGNNNEIVNVRPMESSINSRFHDGPASYDANTKTLFITRNNVVNGKPVRDNTGTVNLKIFQAKRENASWQDLLELPFNSDEYSNAHPCISYDGSTLYFISNRPGGFGGTDIYKSYRTPEGAWTKPENLGKEINTEGNEMFPYIHTDGVLYFASEGHAGLGGLDIFISRPLKDGWDMPENLGAPINTTFDDFGIMFDRFGETGYFSSNRNNGTRNDDIYWVQDLRNRSQLLVAHFDGTFQSDVFQSDVLPVLIVNDVTGGKTQSYPLAKPGSVEFRGRPGHTYTLTLTDGTGQKEISSYSVPDIIESPTKVLGNFIVESVKAEDPGSTVQGEPEKPKDQTDTADTGKTDNPKDENPGEKEKEYITTDFLETLQLNNVYFGYNSSDLDAEAISTLNELVKVLNQQAKMRVEIRAHTDSRGNVAYNQELSRKRAEAARDYLIAKGIGVNRLVMNWFGESQLEVQCPDGVDCDEYKHRLNRRAEFRAIKE